MAGKNYEIDMSRGSTFKNIIKFAIPVIFTSILQLLYNAADIVVVGRWTGAKALAAIGATSSLYALLINVFLGLSIGVGSSVLPAINVFLSTCVLRVLWVFFVFPINPSFYTFMHVTFPRGG